MVAGALVGKSSDKIAEGGCSPVLVSFHVAAVDLQTGAEP